MATIKSIAAEARDIQLAISLVKLGARLQVLESETRLSRERLLKLYKEVKGESPPKGMLPFSADWFLSWQPNVHASLYANLHHFLCEHTSARGIAAVMKAYRLYLEHCQLNEMEPVLTFTRAWTLNRFFEGKLLTLSPCKQCGGHFVVHALDLHEDFVCGLCNVPARAGKTARAKRGDALAA